MGGLLCKGCKVMGQNPKQIHVKKLTEIYNTYLKNQNKDPKTYRGVQNLTPQIVEQVHRYSQQSVKELVRIIQIDSKREAMFITKICSVLIKNTQPQPKWSTELRYLSLVMLMDLMESPIEFKMMSKPSKNAQEVLKKSDDEEQVKISKKKKRKESIRKAKRAAVTFFMKGIKQINRKASKIIQTDVDLFGIPEIEQEQPKDDSKVYLFCVENERQIFNCLQTLLVQQEFELTCYQMLNILVNQAGRSSIIQQQDSYFHLLKQKLSTPNHDAQVKYEQLQAFSWIIRILKESTFHQEWAFIFKATFENVCDSKAKDYIHQLHREQIDRDYSSSDAEQLQIEEIKINIDDEKDEYQELVNQLSFDLFSYISSRISFDQEISSDFTTKFIQDILSHFDNTNEWHNVRWIKFVLMLVVCNGGSLNNNANFNFEETVQSRFYNFLAKQENAQCNKMVDSELVNLITNNILDSIIRDVGSKNAVNESNPVISPMKKDSLEAKEVRQKLELTANRLSSLNDLYYLRVLAPSVSLESTKFNRCLKLMINYLAGLSEGQKLIGIPTEDAQIKEALIQCMHAFLQSYDEVQDLVKYLDTWVLTLRDEVLPRNSSEEGHENTVNPTYIAMFFRLSACILDLIHSRIDLCRDEDLIDKKTEFKFKQISIEHQILFMDTANLCARANQTKFIQTAVKLDLKIKLLNEEMGQIMNTQEPLQHHTVMAYLTSVASLLLYNTNQDTIEMQIDLLQSWFVFNLNIASPNRSKTPRSLTCLLAYIAFMLHRQGGQRLICFQVALTAKIFSLSKLQELLSVAFRDTPGMPNITGQNTNLIKGFAEQQGENLSKGPKLSKWYDEFIQVCETELKSRGLAVHQLQDAIFAFSNPNANNMKSQQSPIRSKDLDTVFVFENQGSEIKEFQQANTSEQSDALITSNSQIDYS